MNTGTRVWETRLLIPCLSLLWVLLSAPVVAEQASATLFDSNGYRIDQFRGPVPDHVPGARTVSTAEVKALIDSAHPAPLLVDVLPSPPKPKGLSPTALWLPPTRHNIPSSIWLPNVGYGRLSDQLDQYFHLNLESSTDGDLAHPIVIYCLADCWMSWNAARRAAEYGFTQVLWYPEGTTGWEEAGLPVEPSIPVIRGQ